MNMNIFKSKTVCFAILIAVLSILQGYVGLLSSPVLQMSAGIVISVGIVILRFLTTQPLSEK
jgi:uncharacterized membrane protein